MKRKTKLTARQFFIIQEGIVLGVLGSVAKIFLENFPLETLLWYLGPIVLGAYGINAWKQTKSNDMPYLFDRSEQ